MTIRKEDNEAHVQHLLARDYEQQVQMDAERAFSQIKVAGQDPIEAVDHFSDVTIAVTGLATVETDPVGRILTIDVSPLGTGDQFVFSTIAVSGQDPIEAEGLADTLTMAAGAGLTITTDDTTGTVTHGLTDMAEATFKGRAAAAGTGAPVDLTATQARTILNVADGANAYSHPNHTGDVTSTGDGATAIGTDKVVTAMILNDNVTLAKIQELGANKLLGAISAGNPVEIDCTAAGRDLLDDADASAQRTTLGLGTMATQANSITIPIAMSFKGSPVVGGTYILMRAPKNCTATAIRAYRVGGTSATVKFLYESTEIDTTALTAGSSSWATTTSLENTGITAGDTIKAVVTIAGNVTDLSIQLDVLAGVS